MPKKRGRGRPPFKPTQKLRRLVSVSAAGGMTHEQIAMTLGIDRDTLAKHFGVELSTGACKRRQEVVDALYRKAKEGNVSAARAFMAHEMTFGVPPSPVDKPQQPAIAKPEKKGKKQIAQEDAVTAQQGTDWHDLLTPGRPQ